jgi:predicted enzyme related to lactoylglutathione lyase
MSASEAPSFGAIAWADLTVPHATKVRDFYKAVVGWDATPVPMGTYDDFQMNLPGTDQPVGGICHARGMNADLPAHWLLYARRTEVRSFPDHATWAHTVSSA